MVRAERRLVSLLPTLTVGRGFAAAALLVSLALPIDVVAQGRGGGAGPQPPASAQAMAPRDFTGYWVSVTTEHWHLRMSVPPKGDFSMLPLNAEARKVANAWDPAKDKISGDDCRAYGAPSIMRVPGRLYIHWASDNVLQVDTDAGSQTRLFRFNAGNAPANEPPSWQGQSVATWEGAGGRGGQGRLSGQLKVTTRRLRPGFLRRNGVPYSANAVVEEYFETFKEPNGDSWLLVTAIVTDPTFLTQPYASTVQFKKIADRSGWDPTPCRGDLAR